MSDPPPLMLCMEKTDGQEVAVQIQPTDDFHSFLMKARSLLGYDVDINSVTHNQPVSLTDNIYQFLLNSDLNLSSELNKPIIPSANTEDLYILDDGTQIRASQIHFDNEDPPVDLTAEKIPFVKYSDAPDDEENYDDHDIQTENKLYNIVESPVRFAKDVSNSLIIPFKLVNNNPSGFEAQFSKYLEASHQVKTYATLNTVTNRNKSPRSLIRENFKNYDESFQRKADDFTHYTREDILNMFKDAPVPSAPYENHSFPEKRRHARKSDPSRLVHKSCPKPLSYVGLDGVLIAESANQNCFICTKFIDKNHEKLYVFDNEDQRLHRSLKSSPQKKTATQLKVICEQCLEKNLKPCRKSPNQSLNPDEYLVIRNNQQYIFQKNNSSNYNLSKKFADAKANLNKTIHYKKDEKDETLNVEIGSDGEILSQSIQNGHEPVVKEEKKDSSSDVEIIENEPEFDDIDNLEDADEEVIEFLGKYQCDSSEIKELKCRFCEQIFKDLPEVVDHGEVHKHVMDDNEVLFPCPLCDYGYANFKWLKGHLRAAHDKTTEIKIEEKSEDLKSLEERKGSASNESSPIARRTRSAAKVTETIVAKEPPEKPEDDQETTQTEMKFEIKTEVKQEALDSSEEEIWIVQAADVDEQNKNEKGDESKKHQCNNCKQLFPSAATLSSHKCRRRGRKPKNKDDWVVCVPSKEDFIKRAQGRIRNVEDSGEDDLLTVRPRKKTNKEPSSDPQVVTCHNCNESFTSKVRLKFHMQFHEQTNMLTPSGDYTCRACELATFRTETELFDHVHFRHHKQRRWQCPVAGCGKTFYLRATLTKHSRTHTDTRRYVCGTCGKRFLDKQTLDEHSVTHLQIKPFQCHFCLKQLTRRSRLRMHLRAHEEEMCLRLVLVCAVCCRAFRDHNDVQDHLTRSPECLKEFTNEIKEEEAVTVQLSPTSGLVRHTVQISEPRRLSAPIYREAAGPEAEALLATVPPAARPVVRCVEIEKAFRCEYCEDVFYSEAGLNTHRAIHKSIKNPFTCHICKVTFATYSRCTTHKTTHGFYKRSLAVAKQQPDVSSAAPSSAGILGYGDFPVVKHFLCEDCGRSYLHWTYLQVHRRMKHANEKYMYKCPQCDLTFPNSWSLSYHRKKQHVRQDADESSAANKQKEREDYRIPCRDCDQVLPNKTALYKHRKKEHSDMSLRPSATANKSEPACSSNFRRYPPQPLSRPDTFTMHEHLQAQHGHDLDWTCETCHKSFTSRSELSVHARTHTARRTHSCAECGHTFKTLSMLNEHARVHSGERPFPCDVCGVAFRRSTAMRNHRLIHSGVRAWACARCPKRFRIRSDLRTHARLKHPAKLLVIEVAGLNPSPEEVMERLTINNIPHDKVIEITKMTFPKNVTSIIPNCPRALEMLSHVPRTQVACSRSRPDKPFELYQPARRGRGIAKNPRRPKILQRGEGNAHCAHSVPAPPEPRLTYSLHIPCAPQKEAGTSLAPPQAASTFPITLNVNTEDLTELNVQQLLREGVLVNGNQMVQLQLDDNMLLE